MYVAKLGDLYLAKLGNLYVVDYKTLGGKLIGIELSDLFDDARYLRK